MNYASMSTDRQFIRPRANSIIRFTNFAFKLILTSSKIVIYKLQ